VSIDEARRHCVALVVPGAFAVRLRGPMRPNLARLQSLGLTARQSAIDTSAGMERNAVLLADDVKGLAHSGKQAVLVGHSSGAVAITLMLARDPELARHVRCAVLMQTTYLGSPIADLVVRAARARPIVERIVQGEWQAIVDVTTRVRKAIVASHPYPADRVATVSLVTRARMTPLLLPRLYMKLALGLESDGLVPTEHQRVPGTHVVERTLDHGAPVMGRPHGRAGDLTEELVLRALRLGSDWHK
jgi:pimeloyl-ACP methyl ester carboxylesterase